MTKLTRRTAGLMTLSSVIGFPSAVALGFQTAEPQIIVASPLAELNDIGYTARCLLLEAMKAFVISTGKRYLEPTHVAVTPVLETLLRDDALRQGLKFFGTHKQPVRPLTVLGMKARYDASNVLLTRKG